MILPLEQELLEEVDRLNNTMMFDRIYCSIALLSTSVKRKFLTEAVFLPKKMLDGFHSSILVKMMLNLTNIFWPEHLMESCNY